MGGGTIWHSRRVLLLTSILLIGAILLADYQLASRGSHSIDGPDVLKDIDYALEAMEYLHDTQNGRSFIRPVVEEESGVREYYWGCTLHLPTRVIFPSSVHSWTTTQHFHLFSAYLDTRANSLYPRNQAVQVLAMHFRMPNTTVYCNLHSESRSTVVVGTVREIWQRGWDPRGDFFVPLLISCPLPHWIDGEKLSVQITTQHCSSYEVALSVSLPPIRKEPAKVAVCVKGLDFQEDLSSPLIEWIEWQFLFGADTVTIYVYAVSPATERILQWYESQGRIELFWIDLPGEDSPHVPVSRSIYMKRNRQQKRRHELIPYNDCLYRHLNSHEFVLIVDIDEIVVPLQFDKWSQLLREAESSASGRVISSISMRNVFKFPRNERGDKSEILPLYSNRIRSERTSKRGDYGKSFSSTRSVATVFNHFALHRLMTNVSHTLHLPESAAIKLHYKSTCPVESRAECPELMRDTVVDQSLDRFSEKIEERVREVRKRIGL
ncbi:hypothetical protein PMAYCL1PPCAC_12016 [Pristionchus mayeri]|uniref:Glycosyltransferase family 92 protein n=1 Tax=Pristionchus mayeri TaxID=1317129 RepID=A0AAN4ZJ84_9BILA|nr:hypothetical protein PMAYCL1PPCAC_12016 [Pristionchus mayeri]